MTRCLSYATAPFRAAARWIGYLIDLMFRRNRAQLYVPPGCEERAGLMICLHGWGQTAARFRDLSQLDRVADAVGCVAFYPAARRKDWGRLNPFDLDLPQLNLVVDDVEDVRESMPFDGRLFIIGYSDGGFFGTALAQRLEPAGLVVYNGGILAGATNTQRKFPVLAIHNAVESITREWMLDLVNQYFQASHLVEVQEPNGKHPWNIEVNGKIVEFLSAAINENSS